MYREFTSLNGLKESLYVPEQQFSSLDHIQKLQECKQNEHSWSGQAHTVYFGKAAISISSLLPLSFCTPLKDEKGAVWIPTKYSILKIISPANIRTFCETD